MCCCSGRADAGAIVEAIVRSVGPLQYLHGLEIVDSAPASLGRPEALVGLPVEGGNHGGPVVGRVIDARREGGALIAKMEIHDSHALTKMRDGTWSQISAEYRADVREDGVQLVRAFVAIAAVPRGRCGDVCSITRADHAPRLSPADAARASMHSRQVAASREYWAPYSMHSET
jgi:hypothetical protein